MIAAEPAPNRHEVRFTPAGAQIDARLEHHRPWLDSVLGCAAGEVVAFELDLPVGEMVTRDLLAGVPLNGCGPEAEMEVALSPPMPFMGRPQFLTELPFQPHRVPARPAEGCAPC
jgi:hypothetical protein